MICFVGVLHQLINPRERKFVCSIHKENPGLMIPLNKSISIIANYTKNGEIKGVPIWRPAPKKTEGGPLMKVKVLKAKKALAGNVLFVVQYLKWREDCPFPLGIVIDKVPTGEALEDALKILYIEHGVEKNFTQATGKEVSRTFPPTWTIPKNEIKARPTIKNAFTIDPLGSVDLDDALTIDEFEDDAYRVGVHISDVSYFVRPNTPLDEEARSRGTSYYPGNNEPAIPMLPQALSEKHCSLLPHVDRLTVSVFMVIGRDGKLHKSPEFRRTITTSCCQLTYAEVQSLIFNQSIEPRQVPDHVASSVRNLNMLAQARRKLRLGDAAHNHHSGNDYKDDFEAHELIEEFMILANEQVAKRLCQKRPKTTPLRTQLNPKEHRLEEWRDKYGKYALCSLLLRQQLRIDRGNAGANDAQNMNKEEEGSLKNGEGKEMVGEERETQKVRVNMKLEEDEDGVENKQHQEDQRRVQRPNVIIQSSVWYSIVEAMKNGDWRSFQSLICNDNNHPQLAVALSHLKRIQRKSNYLCAGEEGVGELSHSSLRLSAYTHFTSPIRRYIDVKVHRLLLDVCSSDADNAVVSDEQIDQMSSICRRCTFASDNQRRFKRAIQRVNLASKLKIAPNETNAFIDSLDNEGIQLYFADEEENNLPGENKRIRVSHLGPIAQPQLDKNIEEMKMKWKLRLYIAQHQFVLKEDEDGQNSVDEEKQQTKDKNKLEAIVNDCNSKKGALFEVSGEKWIELLDAIAASDIETQVKIIERMDEEIKITQKMEFRPDPAPSKDPQSSKRGDDAAWGRFYKPLGQRNENKAQEHNGSCDGHYYEKSLTLRPCDLLKIQLSSNTFRGLMTPDIQLFYLSPRVSVCVEHRKNSRTCFANTSLHQASRMQYRSIEEYIQAWSPVIAMEAAKEAIQADDTFTILDLGISWKRERTGVLHGKFKLTQSYCKSRMIQLSVGDFACVRVSYNAVAELQGTGSDQGADAKGDDGDSNEESSHNNPSINKTTSEGSCEPPKTTKEDSGSEKRKCTLIGSKLKPLMRGRVWVCHCIVNVVTTEFIKGNTFTTVVLKLHQNSSEIPKEILEVTTKSTLEVIRRTIPHR